MNTPSKLVTPTLEDLRKEFPKPTFVKGPVNEVHGYDKNSDDHVDVDHGWISPDGAFFRCEYGGHDEWSGNVMEYWPEIVDEHDAPYDTIKDYNGGPPADYLVSQGWLKWMYRHTHHEILKGLRDITNSQWMRIGWLDIYSSTPKYKIIHVEV